MGTFFVVWSGQLLSLIGSSLTGFALGVWIYQNTGSVTQFGLILVCTTLPGVVISPLAGALVDRWRHRSTMILSDTGGALSTLAIWLLLLAGDLEIWHIYLATAINSTLSAFQWPAYTAAVTLMVPKAQLGRASGMTQMGRALAQLLAPLLGAVLLNLVDLQGIIILDFATFAFAMVTLLSVRFPRATKRAGSDEERKSILQDVLDGWDYVASRPGILGLLLFFAASNFLGGTLQVLVGPLVLSFASPVALGTVMSTGGIGMLVGSLVMSIWGGPKRRIRAILGFMLLCGLSTTVAGLQASVLLIAIAAFVFFFSVPMINACSQVILQEKVEPDLQGRVFALEGAVGSGSLPLAYLVAGPLADHFFEPLMAVDGPLAGSVGQFIGSGPGRGIGLMIVVIGILTMVLTAAAYRFPRLRRVEEELPDAIPRTGVSEAPRADLSGPVQVTEG